MIVRVFPLRDYIQILDAICDTHGVRLEIGGDQRRGTHLYSGFDRVYLNDGTDHHHHDWAVCYLYDLKDYKSCEILLQELITAVRGTYEV